MFKINHWLKENSFFKGARESKLKLHPIFNIAIFFCLWGGSLILGRLIVTPLMEFFSTDTLLWISFALSLRKILICSLQIAAFFIWAKFIEKRRIKTLGFICNHKVKEYLLGFLLGFSAITAIVLTLVFLGAIEITINNLFPLDILIGSLLISTLGWMVQSSSEEIAIRGWLIPILGTRLKPLNAILLTSGVFGVIHLFNNGSAFLSFLNLTLSGLFFALYTINKGNIWSVCGLHFGWNLVQGNIFGLSISGEQSPFNSLFKSKLIGSSFLTGGSFGPEASIITTVFLIWGILLLVFIMHKNSSHFSNKN